MAAKFHFYDVRIHVYKTASFSHIWHSNLWCQIRYPICIGGGVWMGCDPL